MPMETQSSRKQLEFPKDNRHTLQLAMSTILKMETSKLLESTEKSKSGTDIGPRSASEKLQADVYFEAARFRVLDRHRSTKPTTAS